MIQEEIKHYKIGERLVRITFLKVNGQFSPFKAETKNSQTNQIGIDNSFSTDYENGEEVREINEEDFIRLTA